MGKRRLIIQFIKNYPLVALILIAIIHFIAGWYMFEDKITNIYDMFDEWFFSIIFIYIGFIAFIINLKIKLKKLLKSTNETIE
ncbi:MAG: hypothetical protein CMK36_02375 [Porticoccaceae bacterium]|nr:hypothetical protein [Porticoccaceae bacterium]|tara:strand:- start:549 stop:797 length:249 start_codon:yes stop_codon:yes gene_type:complete